MKLPETYRTVIHQSCCECYSINKIADILKGVKQCERKISAWKNRKNKQHKFKTMIASVAVWIVLNLCCVMIVGSAVAVSVSVFVSVFVSAVFVSAASASAVFASVADASAASAVDEGRYNKCTIQLRIHGGQTEAFIQFDGNGS